MSKSLAEMRANKAPASLPTRVVKICLDQAVIAEAQRLEAEKRDIELDSLRVSSDGDQDGPPKRIADAPPARLAEIDQELEHVYDRMRQAEGELLLRAIPGGKWQRWKDAHPSRKENPSDEAITYGLCNASDLLDSLGEYAVSWEGEAFLPGDWDDWFMEKVAPADLRDICTQVVSLHEARISVPKLSSTSSAEETSATD